jgi:hydroxymethylpyrimidine pyrophosphatase-like HAD family hydrolase
MDEQERRALKISLVIADVDGALVAEDKILTPRAQAAVRALDLEGVAIAITSGRPPRGMAMLAEPLSLKTRIAGFNSRIFVTPDMKTIEEHLLAPEAARRAVHLILQHGPDARAYSGKDWFGPPGEGLAQ